MKKIITIGALFLWLVSLAPAEAQYRARIDQAWKRIQEQQKQQDPTAKKNEAGTCKTKPQNDSSPGRTPDPTRW